MRNRTSVLRNFDRDFMSRVDFCRIANDTATINDPSHPPGANESVNFSLKYQRKHFRGVYWRFYRQRVAPRAVCLGIRFTRPLETCQPSRPVRQVRSSPGNSRFCRYEFIKSNSTIVLCSSSPPPSRRSRSNAGINVENNLPASRRS